MYKMHFRSRQRATEMAAAAGWIVEPTWPSGGGFETPVSFAIDPEGNLWRINFAWGVGGGDFWWAPSTAVALSPSQGTL